MPPKKTIFKGILGKPRAHNPLFDSHGVLDPSFDHRYHKGKDLHPSNLLSEEIQSQINKKLSVDAEMFHYLFEHYGIDPQANNRWELLSYCLAIDFVPGFRYEKKRRGRPRKWERDVQEFLLYAVAEYIHEHPHLSQKDACAKFTEFYPFRTSGNNPKDSLYQRFLEAKKALPNAYEEYLNSLKDYE